MRVSLKELEGLYNQSYSIVDRLSAIITKIPGIEEKTYLSHASHSGISIFAARLCWLDQAPALQSGVKPPHST